MMRRGGSVKILPFLQQQRPAGGCNCYEKASVFSGQSHACVILCCRNAAFPENPDLVDEKFPPFLPGTKKRKIQIVSIKDIFLSRKTLRSRAFRSFWEPAAAPLI
jgi:hypothetical protein